MPDLLEVAQLAARAAGDILRERYPQTREVRSKGRRDIVTDADFAAQQTIVELIRKHYPDAAILSEEGIDPPPEADLIWVVDPLDGTTNYARRFPIFSTSIGVVQHRRPIAGVIYDPLHDQLFAARQDQGAQLNGQAIHCAATSEVESAIVALDWGRDDPIRAAALAWLSRVGQECRTIRSVGSAALGLCYIAAGWIDVYFHASLKPWDGAAGQIIAQEAGVKLFNFDRAPWNYTDEPCLACTPGLQAWALASLWT
jgi:myo-inositol-1(or 4)-monophosphatase